MFRSIVVSSAEKKYIWTPIKNPLVVLECQSSYVDELESKRSALRSEKWRPNIPLTPSL
jgi:hypothetical protein